MWVLHSQYMVSYSLILSALFMFEIFSCFSPFLQEGLKPGNLVLYLAVLSVTPVS